MKDYKWLLKSILYLIIYALLAIPGYEIVSKIHIQEPITLFSPVDYQIPFISAFAIIYVFIFYPFIIYTIGYFAFIKPEKADRFFVSLFLVYVVSFIIYIIIPVKMIRPNPSTLPKDFLSQVMANYYLSDPPLNCFPSLHAANSTLAAYYLSKEKEKYWWIFWVIAGSVIISTLFVRQHVIADEIAGFILAYGASLVGEKYIPVKKLEIGHYKVRYIITLILAALISFGMVYSYIP